MATQKTHHPADYITPLEIHGLHGRLLHMPAPAGKKAEIVFVYGHHSSLERWWGLMLVLNKYAAVTMPDLPGFGGMDSLYTIGQKPSIDNLADYLADFIQLRYKKNQKIVLAGLSFGFVVATRMLQRHPHLAKHITLFVSIVGFTHHKDFKFSPFRYSFYYGLTRTFSLRLPATIFRRVALHPSVLRIAYARTHNAKHKFKQADSADEFNQLMEMEIGLWHDNDTRTYMFTSTQFLTFDNTTVIVDVPVWHVSAQADHYFDYNVVEQHMKQIFPDFHHVKSQLTNHAPSVIADEAMAAPLLPRELREMLDRL